MFRTDWSESGHHLDFGFQSVLARELGDLAASAASQGLAAKVNSVRKDCIGIALMEKARTSFEAIQVLCRHLFVGDARAIIRTMVEAIINGAYISNAEDEAADSYADFPDFWRWIEIMELREVWPEIADKIVEGDLGQIRERHEQVKHRFERFKRGEWCAKNLFRRAAHLDSIVGERSPIFRWLINQIWRQASSYIHGSPQSVGIERNGPDPRSLTQSIPSEAARTLHIANTVMLVWFCCFGEYLGKGHEKRLAELMDRMGASAEA